GGPVGGRLGCGRRAGAGGHVLALGGAGGAVSQGGGGAAAPPRRALRTPMAPSPLPPSRTLRWILPALIILIILPWVVEPYQTTLFSYGLVMAIAALGFNLLLGYTGLLSFGHSAYFGVGAYAVALIVKYFKITSLEAFIVGGIVASALVSALFGFVCVRYTRIFFGILTMALSQVLWSLAFKFFWITGGSDGLRVPTPSLMGVSLPPS